MAASLEERAQGSPREACTRGFKMQRSIDQRAMAKRRIGPRRHPHATQLGFTSRQWPFIYVLVGNWIFSLAFFLGMKLIWHWVPAEWNNLGDRLGLVIKDAVFAILPGVIGICIVAAQRMDPKMWVGRMAKPNSSLDINTRFILNTFEQFAAYFVANAGLSLYCPAEEARSLILLTALFLLGRLLFWIGYHRNPYLRAFGFGVTFYPTVGVYIWLVLFIVFGIRIPL
jgi:uncharacterized MAPEG superfamily protein